MQPFIVIIHIYTSRYITDVYLYIIRVFMYLFVCPMHTGFRTRFPVYASQAWVHTSLLSIIRCSLWISYNGAVFLFLFLFFFSLFSLFLLHIVSFTVLCIVFFVKSLIKLCICVINKCELVTFAQPQLAYLAGRQTNCFEAISAGEQTSQTY